MNRRSGSGVRYASHAWAAALAAAGLVGCADDGALELVGTVERTLVELVAPVSEVIVEIGAERGDAVHADQVLVRLDPTLAEADVAQAEAAIAAARTARVVASSELSRLSQLRRRGVASQQDLDRAELARDEADAREREAQARLAAAKKHESDLTLRSPVDGVLDQLPFDEGERVPAGATLAVVLAAGNPWVRVWIPETHRAQVAAGTPATAFVDGVTGPVEGRVRDVSRDAAFTPHYALTERDRVHLVYEARVTLLGPAAADLPAGMPARVVIDLPDPGP
ncbi:MAG TPA: efflux RND transporter periplasmic adaptor subunit [Myxococcota bacterium]|nr:efflux RND transporter periplasmic adaptor subunit [Myxococcota bacterium]